MREIVYSTQFKKDAKKFKSQKHDIKTLEKVIEMLVNDIPLPPERKDHMLVGNYKGIRDCHIEDDWVLLYTKENGEINILHLVRLTSHSELFDIKKRIKVR